ncbi:MAG: hypothetical protein ABIP97_06970 [Chthoniobacterales bacterium]
MMRITPLALIALFAFSQTCFSQTNVWQKAEYVNADFLGIKSYSIEAEPPVGKVFVLRQTEIKRNKVTAINETLVYTTGNKVRLYVLFYDPAEFAFSTPEMKKERCITIRTQIIGWANSRSEWVSPVLGAGWSWSATASPKGVSFSFVDPKGLRTQVEYSASMEDYTSAQKRVPDLHAVSDANQIWAQQFSVPVKK